MKQMGQKLGDQLAAEYVLGTMPKRVRQRFEALLKTNPQMRKSVAEWEARLTPMASSVAEIKPPRRVWQTIQNKVSGKQPANSGWMPTNWWGSLGFWRATAGFAMVSLLALGLLVLAPAEIEPTADSMMVVVMEDEQSRVPAMTVSWEPGGDHNYRVLRLRVIGHAEMAPDTAWELWMLPAEDRPPISLGLITTHELQTLRVPKSLAQPLDHAWGLGMTVEPKGGSPTGKPTNPMLYSGRCVIA